ncbi:filamin A-interacting protein 1-like protein [Lates japonicus]|uniref:Filamin A-interacting protein 1-like protein n=1 Tax=Lates japonicus TaxID=270547 RepID=A0AAD3MDY0_LATJO|nr:filamin A-interacting protein 1-like protein [Lates japonicus]
MRDKKERWEGRRKREDLSRDDLLFLLSILEGELQARDEVITVLKSERTDSAPLCAHYGFSGPDKVLCALQRDSHQAQQDCLQDVYEKPIAKLNHLVEAQKRSSKRMLKQLVEVSRSHSGALLKLEEQEGSHRAFIHKSNCLTSLLEQDRERLKLLIVKEREYQEIKEEKNEREVSALKEELTRLKAFALLVVKEQQCLSELLEQQRRCTEELTTIAYHIKQDVGAAYSSAKKEELKSVHLEVEHHNQVSILNRSQNTMTAPSLLSEVEVLRRRVVEMEGKDEELIRMGDQCRDLDRRLAREISHCRSLKVEVDNLNGRISELDRIEETLVKSKQDCSILKGTLEREREVTKTLSSELNTLKVRVRDLEAAEGQMEKSEAMIRQDLAKLRLQKRLQDKEMLEGELLKVEEDFESLDKRFKEEQRRSRALTEELEVAKRELSRYEQAEKQEVNQEHLLLCRLQKEQVKSRLLAREVDTLKEKLQRLMGTEESICKTTKEVQTEPADSLPPDYSENSEKLDKENDDKDPNHNTQVINRRSSLVNNLNSLNSANNNISQYSSHSGNGIDMHQTVNGEVMMLAHTPGQPLHIKVTPHHTLNTATLEISSPTGDTATSYTSTAVIPTSGASPKQRITIIQNSGLPAVNAKTPPSSPDRTISPLHGTTITRVLSPNSSRSVTPDHSNSPIQIVTVRTCSPEPTEAANQAVFCKTPEWQNSWQHHKSNSTDTSPSIITTEDNKIHIHLGSPYVQSLNGMTHSLPQPVGPYYLRHEQRTQVLTNGCYVKGIQFLRRTPHPKSSRIIIEDMTPFTPPTAAGTFTSIIWSRISAPMCETSACMDTAC